MRHQPLSAQPTQVTEWKSGRRKRILDDLATEEPLEIRINGRPISLTMRTPGDDFDLAAGFLMTEGIIAGRGEIRRIAFARGPDGEPSGNLIDVQLTSTLRLDARLDRHFASSSACGICGKTSIDSLRNRDVRPLDASFSIDAGCLVGLPERLRSVQKIFGLTGGLHAAGLFDASGTLLMTREDIGRHNAVDKVIGRSLLEDHLPLSDRILLVSGRGGFEIVQKALVAGLPIVACISAPSSLAVQLAREYSLTLIGFLRGWRFVIYSGERRVGYSHAVRRSLHPATSPSVQNGPAGRSCV